MKILLDVNVVLDVVLRRDPWALSGARLLSAVERGSAKGFVAAHTLTTVHYVLHRSRDRRVATAALADLMELVQVVPVGKLELRQALALAFSDFEDAVQASCALVVGADYLVTRNHRDFRRLTIPAVEPGVMLSLLARG